MKKTGLILVLTIAVMAMMSCKEQRPFPAPDFSDYPAAIVGEWVLTDAAGVIDAVDITIVEYEGIPVVCTKTVYVYNSNLTGSIARTYLYEDKTTEVVITTHEWFVEENQLTMSWDVIVEEVEYTTTGIHFRTDNELFMDLLHAADRVDQTHLKRYR